MTNIVRLLLVLTAALAALPSSSWYAQALAERLGPEAEIVSEPGRGDDVG